MIVDLPDLAATTALAARIADALAPGDVVALHGGLIPYGGTFLCFSDYCRPSIRLAALMRIPVVYVFTHDSIAMGEDGPTHQAVEQVASLRAIPAHHAPPAR